MHKVVAVGLAIIVMILAVSLTLAVRRHRAELEDAAHEMRTIDLLLAKDTERSLQSISLVLDGLAEQIGGAQAAQSSDLRRRWGTQAIFASLRARAAGLPQLSALTIIGPDGHLIATSREWPAPDIHVADRIYFQSLRDSGSERPFVSEPVTSRTTGAPSIFVAKRVVSDTGDFQGLILGVIELRYFERLYDSLQLDNGSFVTLWRDDGVVLTRYPMPPTGLASFARIEGGADTSDDFGIAGVARRPASAFSPRGARLVASQAVPGFGVHVDISQREAVILHDWRREMMVVGGFVAVAIVCISGLIWALVRRFRAYEAMMAASRERERAVAAQREAEDALRQSQKMEAMGQLTGGVAHDFNNLLTVIQSSVELLRRHGSSSEAQGRYVETIADASGRAAKLTHQLLAFSRRQALTPETFDVVSNIESVSQLIGRLTGAQVTLLTDLPAAPCYVHADPNQFDTAIVNLAVNARDAMPDGGTLRIAVSRREALDARQQTSPSPRGLVAVMVADTGIGIPPAMQRRVFEPFFTTKDVGQGTGLGLSQVIGFAKQSGGDVLLDSQPGEGATFTLLLPESAAAVGDKPEPNFRMEGRGERILVVDDDPKVAALTAQLLRALKYFAVTVGSAADALELLDDDPSGYAAVVSDVVMPGMDGVGLAETVRDRFPALPVLLVSGFSATLADQGTSGLPLLRKPFGIQDLGAALGRLVEGRSAAEENASEVSEAV